MLKIRPEFSAPTKSYAANTQLPQGDLLDCSLGENPYGFPKGVTEKLKQFDFAGLSHYPHSTELHDAIARHWKNITPLSRNNITLTDGSIGALYLLNTLFGTPNAEIVGFAQSFTDMIVNVQMLSMKYKAVPMNADRGYRADADALIAACSEQTAVIYLDNPNNPTGQVMPLADIERILRHAERIGACLLADEAYGDFIEQSESAAALLGQSDNLIVVRSFSKGFGLAGLRAGYILSSPVITGMLAKISNPYVMSSFSRAAAVAALDEPQFPTSHAAQFSDAKQQLISCTGSRLTLLCTDGRVPICTLGHRDEAQNLQQLLLAHGILTVSGAEFEGLGPQFVRLRVPLAQDLPRLLQALSAVNQG